MEKIFLLDDTPVANQNIKSGEKVLLRLKYPYHAEKKPLDEEKTIELLYSEMSKKYLKLSLKANLQYDGAVSLGSLMLHLKTANESSKKLT